MPRPRNERQALEQELAELPEQIAAYQRELAATPVENRARREMREWQIRRDSERGDCRGAGALDGRYARL